MKIFILVINRIMISAILLYSLLLLSGCSSSKGALSFNTLKYPTSMSAFLYDKNHNLVMKGRELDSINSFKYKKTFWNVAYGLIPLSDDQSISDALNEIVEKYKGDGIINLTITIEQGTANKIYSFLMYLPSYIPILPGSARITVSGEVVKLNNRGSSYLPYEYRNVNYTSKENIYLKIKEALNETN
jgi:hypothetical protein